MSAIGLESRNDRRIGELTRYGSDRILMRYARRVSRFFSRARCVVEPDVVEVSARLGDEIEPVEDVADGTGEDPYIARKGL